MFILVTKNTKYNFIIEMFCAIHENITDIFYLVSTIYMQLTKILKALLRTLFILQVPNLS